MYIHASACTDWGDGGATNPCCPETNERHKGGEEINNCARALPRAPLILLPYGSARTDTFKEEHIHRDKTQQTTMHEMTEKDRRAYMYACVCVCVKGGGLLNFSTLLSQWKNEHTRVLHKCIVGTAAVLDGEWMVYVYLPPVAATSPGASSHMQEKS